MSAAKPVKPPKAIKISDTNTGKLREKLNMSQAEFARAFPGINFRTLQNWEAGAVKSEIAKAYLQLIAASPSAVRKFWTAQIQGARR